jgi:hypothetical protein
MQSQFLLLTLWEFIIGLFEVGTKYMVVLIIFLFRFKVTTSGYRLVVSKKAVRDFQEVLL